MIGAIGGWEQPAQQPVTDKTGHNGDDGHRCQGERRRDERTCSDSQNPTGQPIEHQRHIDDPARKRPWRATRP